MSVKIYNEIILQWNDDINQFDTIYEDSFEYDGYVMQAKKGKGTNWGGVGSDGSPADGGLGDEDWSGMGEDAGEDFGEGFKKSFEESEVYNLLK